MIKITNRVSGKTIVVKNAVDVNNYRLTHSGPIDITLIKSIKLDQTLKLQTGDKLDGYGHKIQCSTNIPILTLNAKTTVKNLKIFLSHRSFVGVAIDIDISSNFQGNRKLYPTLSNILIVNGSGNRGGIGIRCSGNNTYAQYLSLEGVKINNMDYGLLLDGTHMRYFNTAIMKNFIIFNCNISAEFINTDMNTGSFILERNDAKNAMVFRNSSRNDFTGVRWDHNKIFFDENSDYNYVDIKSSGDKPAWVNKGKHNFVSFARNKDINK